MNYTERRMTPLHGNVSITIKSKGTAVDSPAGPAIGCSNDMPCDITWKVDLKNNTCPCAVNISCYENGVTLSFWWTWDFLDVPHYRFFIDLGGIYTFYNPSNGFQALAYRIYGSRDFQWYNNLRLPHGSWRHVVIMVQSSVMTVYYDGRFYGTRGATKAGDSWFPGASELLPRLRLKSVPGNYSFGKLYLWENKQSAAFLWRQHYEDVEQNDKE